METKNRYITPEQASNLMCYALSHWKITYHYTKGEEVTELNLENPDNGDVMEVLFRNDRIWEIAVTTDTEIIIYDIKEEKGE